MAKVNYQNTIATTQPINNNISDWVTQQEKMNLFMDKYQKDLINEGEKKLTEKKEKLKKQLDEVGYGKNAEFKLTGNEAANYNIRKAQQALMDLNYKYDQEIKKLIESGEMDPYKMAEFKQRKELIYKAPENFALAQQKYLAEVADFEQGLKNRTYLPTPENLQRLKRMKDGEYEIIIDQENPSQFYVVFDNDGDGKDDMIPFEDFANDKSLGQKVRNFDMVSEAQKVAKTLGEHENVTMNGFYKETEKGLVFNDNELLDYTKLLSLSSPEQMNSYAFQKYGVFADQLNDQQKQSIYEEFALHLKSAVNTTTKKEFDSGAAGYSLGKERLQETKDNNKRQDQRWWTKFNFDKNKASPAPAKDFITINKGQKYTAADGKKYVVNKGKETRLPTYSIDKLKITITDEMGQKKPIEIHSVTAIPKVGGGFVLEVSDGTEKYSLNEQDLSKLSKAGITREVIMEDYKSLNNQTNSNNSINKTKKITW